MPIILIWGRVKVKNPCIILILNGALLLLHDHKNELSVFT